MNLYFHAVSITCRPILLLAADEGIALKDKDGKFLGLEEGAP
jgi:hypothetical protein